MHLVVLLEAHCIRLYLLVVDTHQRPAANHVIASVLTERLQRCGTGGAFLQLVEEQQRLPRYQFHLRVQHRYILQDGVHLVAVVENAPILFFQHKVHLHHRLIMRLAERPYRHGLSNLAGTIDDEWLMIGIPVPLFQITINLSFKQIHNDNHIFSLQRYNKNHIFGAFYPTFFTFPSIFLLLSLILDYMFLHTIVAFFL